MTTRAKLSVLALCALAVGGYAAVSGAAGGIRAEPIPPGYEFPTPKATINKWVSSDDVAAMRNHAWNLWAGMTAPAQAPNQGLPIWETWYSTGEVFSTGPLPADGKRTRPHRPFVDPNQFHHFGRAATGAAASQVVSFNKFDATSATFLRASHPTPPNSKTSYKYISSQSLTQLNNAWPTRTPVQDRKIVPFLTRGIDTKPVFMLVTAQGLTPIPFWQGPAASTAPNCKVSNNNTPSGWARDCHPDSNTWTSCVLVDPKATGNKGRKPTAADLKAAVANSGLACKDYPLVVPVSMFYHFRLNAQEAAAFNQAQSSGAKANDFAILVAMHVTTKEIDNWTWQTYWWQAGTNPPNNYPGTVGGMIGKVKGPWRNYAMCTAYSTPTQKPIVCFNPFLEPAPSIPDGLNSNCMSCHSTARFPGNNNFPNTQSGYPPQYPYAVNPSDPIFSGQTQNDFAWAIAVNAN